MLSISEKEVESWKDGSVAKFFAGQIWGPGFGVPELKVGARTHTCDLNPPTGDGYKNPQKLGPARLACAVQNRRPCLKTKTNAQAVLWPLPTHTEEVALAAKTPPSPSRLQIISHDSVALSKQEKVIARQNSYKANHLKKNISTSVFKPQWARGWKKMTKKYLSAHSRLWDVWHCSLRFKAKSPCFDCLSHHKGGLDMFYQPVVTSFT